MNCCLKGSLSSSQAKVPIGCWWHTVCHHTVASLSNHSRANMVHYFGLAIPANEKYSSQFYRKASSITGSFIVAQKGQRLLQPHSTLQASLATALASPSLQLTLSHAIKAGREVLEVIICLLQSYLCGSSCSGGLYAAIHCVFYLLLQGSNLPLHSFHQTPQLAYLGLLSLHFSKLVIYNLGNPRRNAYS